MICMLASICNHFFDSNYKKTSIALNTTRKGALLLHNETVIFSSACENFLLLQVATLIQKQVM